MERDNYTWDIVLSPSKVELQDVLSEMIEGILYIKLNTIKEETNVRFKEVIEETNFEECRGLILDVRNLSTQQLEEVVKISDLFLDEGIAFKVQTKSEGVRVFTVGELYYDMPLVVITNSETLGGAEALVLALRDRATILGSDTGGQIYSQKIIAFEDGTGMSVASGKICDQYGEALSKNGISPDIRVYLDKEDRLTKLEQGYLGLEDDTYLQRALTMFQ